MSEYSSGPIIIPKGFNAWQGQANELVLGTPESCQDAYERKKLAGAVLMPEQRDLFVQEAKEQTGYSQLEDAAHANNWADSGKGKLVIPFVHVVEAYPLAWPGPGQLFGSCVAWGQRNANLLSMCCEVVAGTPDHEHGRAERFPEVSKEAEKNGVLSIEAIYWHRGRDSHGWFCGAAARVSQQKAGCVLRQDYPDLGFDLTRLTAENVTRYGRRAPPQSVVQRHDDNLIRAAAQVSTFEGHRDALYNGYGINACGSEGFENRRDEWGFSRRTTQWMHAMGYIGADERPVTIRRYGEPLLLKLNSWSIWNRGPRAIYDSARYVPPAKKELWRRIGLTDQNGDILIPHGAFWVRWSDVRRRDSYVMSSVNGWPRQDIDWGDSLWG